MKFENEGTKDLTFLPISDYAIKLYGYSKDSYGNDTPNTPEELYNDRNIIWSMDTNLKDEVDYHVWLFSMKNDDKKYAVVVDSGNGWFYWDGSVIDKDKVIIQNQ